MKKRTKGILIKEEVGFEPEMPVRKVKSSIKKETSNDKKKK